MATPLCFLVWVKIALFEHVRVSTCFLKHEVEIEHKPPSGEAASSFPGTRKKVLKRYLEDKQ
jgi:hypothetical protein